MKLRNQISLFLLLASVISACGTVKHRVFDYEVVRVQKENGLISLSFTPHYEPEEILEKGKRIVVWSKPYHFNVQYESAEERFIRGEICEVKIVSVSGTMVYETPACIDDVDHRTSSYHAARPKLSIGIGILNLDIPYEAYKVSFRFVIYGENNAVFETGIIDETVETDYYEERHIG